MDAIGFNMRVWHPFRLVVKFAKRCGYKKDPIIADAFDIVSDAYRTFAPLKHTHQSVAMACLEVSTMVNDIDIGPHVADGKLWSDRFDIERFETLGKPAHEFSDEHG